MTLAAMRDRDAEAKPVSNSADREPWFLEGRRSVLQRAVLMSLVLGGLGFVAGIGWLVGVMVLINLIPAFDEAMLVVFGGTGCLALGGAVAIPYSRWLSHPPAGTALRVVGLVVCGALLASLVSSLMVLVESVDSEIMSPDEYSNRWLRIPIEYLLLFGAIWLAWSVAFVRRSWMWPLMAGLSAASILLLPVLIFGMDASTTHLIGWLPLEVQQILAIASGVTVGGQFFALLVIPWGIPFWFPPERNPAPFSAAQG